MLFPTLEFSIFALVTLSIWLFLPKNSARLFFLVVFNIFFYSFYNPALVFYLMGWSVVIWLSGKYLKIKYFVILFSILQLIFWKCIDAKFFTFPLFSTPLGISFFTFQGLTYLFARMKIPVHRKDEHLDYSWGVLKVFAFTGFFPTVLSGPILRAKYWENQYNNPSPLNRKTFNYAMTCIALGAFYKLCLSSIFHDYVAIAFSNPKEETGINLLLGVYSYTFEIFHDFAGYSLMAIGIALLYGFNLPDNFRQPYLSLNIREFWQKWHISFSTWLRDYFYIALGGSKVSTSRHLLNTMIIMLVCGAWHGLTGNYLIWGLMHGLAVCVFHLSKNILTLPKFLSWFITFNYVALAWIFFRSPDALTGYQYLSSLFNLNSWHEIPTIKHYFLFLLFIGCFFIQKIEPFLLKKDRNYQCFIFSPYFTFIFWSSIFILILILSPSGMPPFIYFSY